MTGAQTRVPTGRGCGRHPAEEVRADVLQTVAALLLGEGSADLTFERISRQAGVSKTTLQMVAV